MIDFRGILEGRVPKPAEIDWLKSALLDHPYASSFHAMRCRAAHCSADPATAQLLRQAAIRSNSRKQLQAFVQSPEPGTQIVASAAASVQQKFSREEKFESNLKELDAQLWAEAMSAGAAIDLITHDPIPLKGVSETKLKVESNDPEKFVSTKPDRQSFSSWLRDLEGLRVFEQKSSGPKRAEDIIESFIANEHDIVPKRAEFFSPVKAAKQSITDREEIVSETLARIYANQGNAPKAISTYEKLSLLHPEKSGYFAALIENLKSQKS